MVNAKLLEHLAGFTAAMGERMTRDRLLRERSQHLNPPTHGETPSEREERLGEYLSLFEEILVPAYRAIDLHAAAILKLANDEGIAEPVRRCARMAAREVRDARDIYTEAQYAEDDEDAWMVIMKFVGGAVRIASQQRKINDELNKLGLHLKRLA